MVQKFIDEFELLEVLGKGSQGEVYCAYDRLLRRRVALKILKPVGVENTDQMRALREARSLARLQHPNIITLFGISRADDSHVLVMEYSDGTPLTKKLMHGALPFSDIETIMRQLASALQYAADCGLAHGDIKPGNIMISDDGVAKLLDFGLATVTDRGHAFSTLEPLAETASHFEGTIAYTAPEKILGYPSDARSDIFSLGAVLYEMISGKPAFLGPHHAATLNNILNEHPPLLARQRDGIRPWCQPLVDAMLAKDPKSRLATMAQIADFLPEMAVPTGAALRIASGRQMPTHTATRARPMFISYVITAVAALTLSGSSPITERTVGTAPLRVQLSRGIDRLVNFHEKGAVAEAQTIFGRIVEANPNHSAANAGLALAYIRDYTSQETDPSTLRRATALAEQALDFDPQLALANIAAAWAAEFNENFPRAVRFYDRAESLDPGNALALEGRARTQLKQQQVMKAEATLREALRLHPTNRVFFDDLGAILSAQGKHAEAEHVLRRGLALHPDNVRGYASLSHVLYMQEKVREAIQTAQLGLQIRPDASLYNNLGTYLFFEGLYEQAAVAFSRTLEIDGNTHASLYWANLADAYRWLPDKQSEATSAYRQAIRLLRSRQQHRPGDSGINTRMALYAAKANDRPLAQSNLDKLNLGRLTASGDLYRVATAYEVTGNRNAALQFLRRAMVAGYSKKEIANDPELAKLRQDRRYHLLLEATENLGLGRKNGK